MSFRVVRCFPVTVFQTKLCVCVCVSEHKSSFGPLGGDSRKARPDGELQRLGGVFTFSLIFGPLGPVQDRCADAASVFCLQESQRERAKVEERYIKHKEIVWDLQYQLDESKRKAQEYRVRHALIHQCSRLKNKNTQKELRYALPQPAFLGNNPHLFYLRP